MECCDFESRSSFITASSTPITDDHRHLWNIGFVRIWRGMTHASAGPPAPTPTRAAPTFPRRRWHVIGLFFALAVLVAGDKFVLGEFSLVRLDDVFDSNMVEFQTLGRLLLQHGPFSWYPNTPAGRPSHAFHIGPFYPLTLVAQVIPLWLLYATLRLLLMVGAGYAGFRFARDYLGFESGLATVLGAALALSSQTQRAAFVHTTFNFVFPLAAVWSLGLVRGGARSWTVAATGLVVLTLLAYPLFTVLYFPIVHLLLVLLVNPRHQAGTVSLLGRWAAYWIGHALLMTPVVYALLDYRVDAQRLYYPRAGTFIAWILEAGPELAGGSLLVGLIGGALAVALREPLVRRLVIVNAVPFLVAAFFNSSAANYLRRDVIGQLDFYRFFFVQNFLIVLLAFAGLRAVLDQPALVRRYVIGVGLALVLLGPGLYRMAPFGAVLLLNLLVPLGIAIALERLGLIALPARPPWWLGFVALLIVITLVRVHVFYPGQEDVAYRRYFAANPDVTSAIRLAGVGRTLTLGYASSLADNLGAESADVWTAAFSRRYRDLWRVAMSPQLTAPEDRASFEWKWYELNPLNGHVRLGFEHRLTRELCPTPFVGALDWNLPVLLTMNVSTVISLRPVPELEQIAEHVVTGRCIAEQRGWITFNKLRRFFSPAPLWVYVLKDRFERGYLVSSADILTSDADVLDAIAHRSVRDFRRTVLLTAADAARVPRQVPTSVGGDDIGRATLVEYGPDRLRFDVLAAAPAWLVVLNNFDRHWTAQVGTESVPVIRANHAFQAVRISAAGRWTVMLEHRDRGQWLTYLVVPLGLALVILSARPGPGTAPGPDSASQ